MSITREEIRETLQGLVADEVLDVLTDAKMALYEVWEAYGARYPLTGGGQKTGRKVALPVEFPAWRDDPEAATKCTVLMREAIERGRALEQAEIDKAFGLGEGWQEW